MAEDKEKLYAELGKLTIEIAKKNEELIRLQRRANEIGTEIENG